MSELGPDPWIVWWPRARDVALVVFGLVLLGHAFFLTTTPNVIEVAAGFGLVGLPWPLQADDRRRSP